MPLLKKSSSRRRRRFGDFLAVLLLAVIVVFALWFWWEQKHSQKTSPLKPAKIVYSPPARLPLAPIPVPAPPVQRELPVSKTNPVAIVPTPQSLPPETENGASPVRTTLELQIALARRVISPGTIDGVNGSQTRAALAAFQRSQHLPESGSLDADTRVRLLLDAPVFTNYVVTTDDLASLQPLGQTWLAKSEQSSLAYETELELVAEKAHSSQTFIRRLNPAVDWQNISAGTILKIPDVAYPESDEKAALVVIHLSQNILEAFDARSNLLAHFPCSIAKRVEKRPVGELRVVVVISNPNYTANPELFSGSAELQALGRKVVVPPGPNNPVGVAWIGLDRPGYGMHGTPVPEHVGRTESHGCFRLANWDAAYLLKLSWVGMPVEVVP